ncbi:MAG: coenzyme F420-0:L-glutamate ligase [Chloroflexi bacterium]|nr:coenzyme F420-0:L-glutamate ligase [Chloroflexota bacterium]
MDPRSELRIIGLRGIPEVRSRDDLAQLILTAAEEQGLAFEPGDILVVTQKIVSKAEGRVADLEEVAPSPFAREYARVWQRDARLVELVLREARRIVRMDRGIIITETRHGFVCANAGIDRSNVPGNTIVSLLPDDPDASAERIRSAIVTASGSEIGVVISDTFGRPWREGTTDVAIGIAGLEPLHSYVGVEDPHGYELRASVSAVADELCSAAELVLGKVSGIPVALIRGFAFTPAVATAASLVRGPATDMFR